MTTVFIPRERRPGETRVAATPETVKKLKKAGLEVLIGAGAGDSGDLRCFRAARRRPCPGGGADDRTLATLDVLAGLADVAARRNYSKPHVHDGDELVVHEGRHPVVETMVATISGSASAAARETAPRIPAHAPTIRAAGPTRRTRC